MSGRSEVQGGFGDEIAQPIAAQTQLWKNEEIGPGPAGFGGELEVGVEVPGISPKTGEYWARAIFMSSN